MYQTITLPDSDGLLLLADVLSLTGWSRPTLYRRMANGTFPRPRKVGRASVWVRADLSGFLSA